MEQKDVEEGAKRYRVVSPVLAEQYLQDEIITAAQAGDKLGRWLTRGAVRKLGPDDNVPGVIIQIFVLDDVTPNDFAKWFASTVIKPIVMPEFFNAHRGRYEFPVHGGFLTLRDVDSGAALMPEGYYRVVIHRHSMELSTSSAAEFEAAEGLSFRMILLRDGRLKLQARCDMAALQAYFQALLRTMLIRWPDAEIVEPGVDPSGIPALTPERTPGTLANSGQIRNAQTGSGTQWNVSSAQGAHDVFIGSHVEQNYYGTSGPNSAPPEEDRALAEANQAYRQLYSTLVSCGLSGDAGELLRVYTDARLAPWRETLLALPREVAQPADRIHAAIAYLYDGTHPTTGENGLVLLLQVLGDQAPGEPCGAELRQRIQEITARLGTKPPWWDIHRLFRYSWDGVNEDVTRRQRQNYLLVAGGTVLASLIALGFLQAGVMIPGLKQNLGLPPGALPTVLGFCIRSFFLALIGFMCLGLILFKWIDKQVIFSVARNLSLLGLVYLGCAAVPLSPMLLPTWAVPLLLLPLSVLALWWIFFQSMLEFYWRKRAYGDLALEALIAIGCFGLLWYPIERLMWQPLFSFIQGGLG